MQMCTWVLGVMMTWMIPVCVLGKAKVAVFPLAGDAPAELRERVGFSLRAKLDRDGAYEVIDGYTMADAVAGRELELGDEAAVRASGAELEAAVLIWGELGKEGPTLTVKVLDTREAGARPRETRRAVARAQDLRFVTEAVAEMLPGVRPHAHPSEEAVHDDAAAAELWKTNPDLVTDGGFDEDGKWTFIHLSQQTPVKLERRLPIPDEVVITEVDGGRVLAMRMSRTAAETNGLAVLSQPITIEPATRYRLSFRYRSDGPKLHVFVKGYTQAKDINGEMVEREIYRRQVPPTGATNGQWVTVVDDLNPQHVSMPVQTLRVDLYVYLNPGLVMFDDVTLKAVGKPTRDATDAAIDLPVTRPVGE